MCILSKKITPRLIMLVPFILKIFLSTISVGYGASRFLNSLQRTSRTISLSFPVKNDTHLQGTARVQFCSFLYETVLSKKWHILMGVRSHAGISLTQVPINSTNQTIQCKGIRQLKDQVRITGSGKEKQHGWILNFWFKATTNIKVLCFSLTGLFILFAPLSFGFFIFSSFGWGLHKIKNLTLQLSYVLQIFFPVFWVFLDIWSKFSIAHWDIIYISYIQKISFFI